MWVTVRAWEQVVVLRDGRIERVLALGRHRLRRRRTELTRLDVREHAYSVPGQEILTADSVAIRLSVTAVWRIVDAVRYLSVAAEPASRLHTELQQSVRLRVARLTMEQLLATRGELADGLAGEVSDALAPLGVEVPRAEVRDVTLPAEVRRAVTEVLLAREHGRAELERARSEAAALRSLANTARLLEEHPALLHLRTLQAAGSGATLVVAGPGEGGWAARGA